MMTHGVFEVLHCLHVVAVCLSAAAVRDLGGVGGCYVPLPPLWGVHMPWNELGWGGGWGTDWDFFNRLAALSVTGLHAN